MERKVYGIDLGTTYSAIATLDENALPQVIENFNDGGNLLASAVYFPEGGDPVVGNASKSQSEIEPERVVQFVKREIGKANPQIYEFDGMKYDPITISSIVLKRMKEYADEQGEDVRDVVITCPAYFGTEERNATRQAGEIAGLNVLNIVNEPTAAALNYCSREFRENRKIMVYDLGGGTFDITLFDFAVDDDGKASIDVIKTGGDDRLGGIDWDSRMFDHICELYTDEFGISVDDMDAELRQIIRNLVEDTKKALSNMATRSFTVNYAGDSTRITVTREMFEDQTRDLVERTLDFVRRLLGDAGIGTDDVDVVLLVGGSTKMPMIKTSVEGLFPSGKVRVEQPDLAVAKGAALAAAIEFNERVKELTEKIEEIAASGGNTEEISALAEEYEFVAPEVFESIDSGEASSVEEVVKAAETIAFDSLINVPSTMSGSKVISEKLNKSYGLMIWSEADGGNVIDNLMFFEDPSPSEVTKCYQTMGEGRGSIPLRIFENLGVDRIETAIKPYRDLNDIESMDEYYEAFESAFDLPLMVKCISVVELPIPVGTPAGTPIEVTFISYTGGIKLKAKNLSTNDTIEAEIVSANTMSRDELEQAKQRFATLKTSGQI